MTKKLVLLASVAIVHMACCTRSAAQGYDYSAITRIEDSLVTLADSMYSASLPDERPVYCERFVKTLVRALKTTGSYKYSFTKLQNKISILLPDDQSFRVFNWVVPQEPMPRFYGAVQMNTEDLKLYPLIDCSLQLGKEAIDTVLTNGRWYGALYYRILKQDVEGVPTYFMLGWNGSSPISNKKVIDPMRLSEKGVVFGAPLFGGTTEGGKPVQRFMLEYKKDVNASMNWDESTKMIVFDRLVSAVNDPNRKYTYVPSGQYDGFRWVGSRWQMVSDLIPVQVFKDGEAPAPAPRAQK